MTLTERDGRLNAIYNSAQLGSLSFSFLCYGAAVRVRPEPLMHCFLVNIPLGGSAEVRTPRTIVNANATRGWVLSPLDTVDMRWGSGTSQLIVRLERARLEQRLEALLGHPLDDPLRFDATLDVAATSTQAWLRFVALARSELERGNGASLAPAQLEELIACGLLLSQPNNYSTELGVEVAPARSRSVRRALEFIDAHASESISVVDVAAASGVGQRTLQAGFRRELGRSPSQHLADVRFERARAELQIGAGTVTEVALRSGFSHLGRFAAGYRRRFGIIPSAESGLSDT